MGRVAIALAVFATTVSIRAAGCGSEDLARAAAFERVDSVGIDVVRVPPPSGETVEIRSPSVRIGSDGIGGPAQLAFELISGVLALPNGDVLIVDNRGGRVGIFDSSGDCALTWAGAPPSSASMGASWIRGRLWDYLDVPYLVRYRIGGD